MIKEPPPLRLSVKEGSWGPDELSDKPGILPASTSVSEGTTGAIGLAEILNGLTRQHEMPFEEWIDTKNWLGVLKYASSRSALRLILSLQGTDFTRSAKVRLSYYLALRHSGTLQVLTSALNDARECVKYSHTQVLETVLGVFEGLVANITLLLLDCGVLPQVEMGLKRTDVQHYQVCLVSIVALMGKNNGHVQGLLSLPSAYPLIRLIVELFYKLTEPILLLKQAENVKNLVMRFDGLPVPAMLLSLKACGLLLALSHARSVLSTVTAATDTSIEQADALLQDLQLLD